MSVSLLFLGCGSWVGSHLILAHPPVRSDLIEKYGQERFKMVFNGVSMATLVPTMLYYVKYGRGKGIQLWQGNSVLNKSLGLGFKAAGAFSLSQVSHYVLRKKAIARPSPVITKNQDPNEIKGISRISRHSMFMAFALMGVGNLLTRGFLSDIIVNGTFPIFWLIGGMHQDYRLKDQLPSAYFENTSHLPFVAMIQGKQSFEEFKKEIDWKSARVALMAPLLFLL